MARNARAPFLLWHVTLSSPLKSVPLEKRPGTVLGSAGKHVTEPELPRVLDGPYQQLSPDSLALESRDGVQCDDFAGALAAVRLDGKGTDTCEMTAANRRTVTPHQDLGDFFGISYPQVALLLAPLEQLLHLGEIVDAQPLDPAVVFEREECSRPLVREQLTLDPPQIAEVDGVDPALQSCTHGLQHGAPVPDANPLRLPMPQQPSQHEHIHEGHESSFVRNPAFRIDKHELADSEPDYESLGEVRQDAMTGAHACNGKRVVAQRAPNPIEEGHRDPGSPATGNMNYTGVELAVRGLRDTLEDCGELRGTGVGSGPAPDQQQPCPVRNQIRRHRSERFDICRPFNRFGWNGNHQGLTAEFTQVETLLPETMTPARPSLPFYHGTHRSSEAAAISPPRTSAPTAFGASRSHASSYHNRDGPATSLSQLPRVQCPQPSRRATTPRSLLLIPLVISLVICRPEAGASTGLLAAEHRLAVAAGTEILRQGGNAVDAAVAAAAALGVVNPISCGLGGGGFMLIYDATADEAHALDYREAAPAAATPELFRDRGVARITRGPLAIAVPGEPAGLTSAHERFGLLPLATVLAPAIGYARDGFPIEAHLADGISTGLELLRSDPALTTIFLHPDGTPRERGEHLRQTDLAESLTRLASEGAAPFYRGVIAAAIARTVTRRGGLLTAEDLAAYRVRWRAPLRGRYRGRTVLTMPPPGSGGVLLSALNVLSAYELAPLELGSPTYLHLVAETMKAVFADRARYYGDPEFVDVPVAHLTSHAHARAIRERLSAIRVLDLREVGPGDAGTSHISVVDTGGNAVALTTTINTAFGSGTVACGTGIILNNQMADFSLEPGAANVFGLVATAANVVAPNKRPLSSMSPTVLLHRGRPEIVIGGSGGPMIITATLQTLLALIDFDLSPTAAAETPRIHHQGVPDVLLAEPGIPRLTRLSLERLGHHVRTADSLGAVSVVRIGPGGALGAGAPRKGGAAGGPEDPAH